jgi:hypothetical protein
MDKVKDMKMPELKSLCKKYNIAIGRKAAMQKSISIYIVDETIHKGIEALRLTIK